jgi:hypothetical protein
MGLRKTSWGVLDDDTKSSCLCFTCAVSRLDHPTICWGGHLIDMMPDFFSAYPP